MTPRPEEKLVNDEVKIEQPMPALAGNPSNPGEECVISGVAGSFPDSDGVYMFRDKLMGKVDLVSDDDRRWSKGDDDPECPHRTGKIYNVEKFDAGFFGVQAQQANIMDPLLRVALERVYEAIMDAGVNPRNLYGSRTGVFAGVCFSETEKVWFFDNMDVQGQGITNCTRGTVPNRISYYFGFEGPSYVIDSACSSSMYCLDRALESLQSGECDSAVVLGSTLCLHPYVSKQFFRLGVLSPEGVCRCFDESANGYARAEGVVAVFLQKAKVARRVYARIVHSKINCDGFKDNGITFPSRQLQLELLNAFYKECRVDPTTLSYVEAHATSTRVGDPEECNAIDTIFCTGRKEPLLIGSIKSNMGHSEPTSGLCSITKAIIAFETGMVAPNLNYTGNPRQGIPGLTEGRLKVVTEPTPLPGNKGLIGVSSFGFGGANAHALLEWHHKTKQRGGLPLDNIPRVVTVSGRTQEAVTTILDDLKSRQMDVEFIQLLNDLFADHQPGHEFRGYGVYTVNGEKARQIKACDWLTSEVPKKDVTLVLPGLGGRIPPLARSLLNIPAFYASVEACQSAMYDLKIDVIGILTDDTVFSKNVQNAIIGNVAFQMGVVDSLASVGVFANNYVGYSIGELACAYATHNLTAQQAIRAAYYIGKALLESKLTLTATLNIGLNKEHVSNILPDSIKISAIIGKNETIVVGPVKEVRSLQDKLIVQGVKAKLVEELNYGFHSQYLEPAFKNIVNQVAQAIPLAQPRRQGWMTTATVNNVHNDNTSALCSPEYFANLLTSPLNVDKVMSALPADSFILEAGKPLLERSVKISQEFMDNSVQFFAVVGELYLTGVNVTLAGVYPRTPYPVSRSTPMISPLVKWDHSKNHFVSRFDRINECSGGELKKLIALTATNDAYIKGHVIDGRILFPATGYIWLVSDLLVNLTGDVGREKVHIFKNVQFHRATTLTPRGETTFKISMQKACGNFEIVEGGMVIVSGHAEAKSRDGSTDMADPEFLESQRTQTENKEYTVILDLKDVYKELRLRGYHYTGFFRGLHDVDSDRYTGKLKWNDNFVAFMDTMLQMKILSLNNRDLYVPIAIGKIVIDPLYHFSLVDEAAGGILRQEQTTEDTERIIDLPINYYPELDVIKAGGVEIWNLRAQQIPRRKPLGDPVLEKYLFSPSFGDFSKGENNFPHVMRLLVHLALENLSGIKIRVVEVADENLPILAGYIAAILSDLPLVQADVHLDAKPKSKHAEDLPLGVTLSENALSNEKDCAIVVGKDLLCNGEVLTKIQTALKPNGYLISRDHTDSIISEDEYTILAQYTAHGEKFSLLRKKSQFNGDVTVVKIPKGEDFSWIEPLKTGLQSLSTRTILVSENDTFSGILGLTNCLLKESSNDKIRCVYIRDETAPAFNLTIPFYADQLAKDLVINVYENGQWGSYRHHAVTDLERVPSKHVYVNNAVRGDISSLTLFQGEYNRRLTDGSLGKEENLVQLCYTAINFKDVMIATGKITLPSVVTEDSDLQIGFEFSGIDAKGRRVMGLVSNGAMTTHLVKPIVLWEVPDQMSLAEACSIPCVYSTVYMCIVTNGKACKGESILIHSGCGGIGLAAINMSLKIGLEIFVTVGTADKRKFLRENYPQIPDSHIGNSRDTSFEDMIMQETNQRGVDLVLNSLADEKLEASIRCLAAGGRFLEIGKYDLLKNSHIATETFTRGASYHAVMLDVAINGDEDLTKMVAGLLDECIKRDYIKPLPITYFDINEPETAFRYMTTGKHIGKVIMKVRDESELTPSKVFNAVPRYYCNPKGTYIIIGGLGGFGLELASWLVTRGARSMVVTSRTGVKSGYHGSKVRLWRRSGVNVKVATDDVSTENGVTKLLTDANAMGSVVAIFNLAVVLKDSVFENQTEETFRVSFSGKARATKLLDKISRVLCPKLEDFVVFSSVSCGRGNAGQTNYGMSNSVMERICEKRKAEGLPALAVQWGAVGEVGLVADMAESNLELVIGGTLQQTIQSCLQTLDKFLVQDSPVVASMVVAEKRSMRKAGDTVVDAVAAILGIKDLKTVTPTTSLSELGMDSMTAVEVKQTLERDFEVFLTAQDLRGMTFAKLALLDSSAGSGKSSSQEEAERQNLGLGFLVRSTPTLEEASQPIYTLKTSSNSGKPVVFIPGIDGVVANFDAMAGGLNHPAISVRYPHNLSSIQSTQLTAQYMLKSMANVDLQNFKLVGYSAGGPVVLEMAHILEQQGRLGHIVLIDGAPQMISTLTKQLGLTNDPGVIDNAVILALQESISSVSATQEKDKYASMSTREEKLNHLESITSAEVKEKVGFTVQYLRDCATDLMQRVQNVMSYAPTPMRLSSKVTLIKPSFSTCPGVSTEDFGLAQITEQAVEIVTIAGNHLTMLEVPELTTRINSILSS